MKMPDWRWPWIPFNNRPEPSETPSWSAQMSKVGGETATAEEIADLS